MKEGTAFGPDNRLGSAYLLRWACILFNPPFLESLELKIYDARSVLRQAPPGNEVAIIAIDDDSINS